MPELTREEKLKLLQKLPSRLSDLITSEDTGAALLYLGHKHNLSDDKVKILSKILGDVILGIISVSNLPSEISTKAAVDTQTAGNLAQDLNDLILAPKPPSTTITAPVAPAAPAPAPVSTPSDKYREPPEIIDLRKTPPVVSKVEPPPPMQMPVAPASIPPTPLAPPKPLTFTRPIEPVKPALPLIEAEPHKIPITDTYREPIERAPFPTVPLIPIADAKPKEPLPQYIIHPPGLPPTDHPRDILNLKDKEEF